MELLEKIGNTPMIEVDGVYLKLEYMNPSGSHKDRAALYMLREAQKSGLKKGDYVVEYTSGNTGIAVTWISRALGFKPVILVPESVTQEKVMLIKLLGGEVRYVTPDMDGDEYAQELAEELGGVYLAQRKNLANFRAHYETTGPEIYARAQDIECFVMGVGTGGTLYGVGKYLREMKKEIRNFMLIPKGSLLQEKLLGEKTEDEELLEGFSYHSFDELINAIVEEKIVDEIKTVSSEQAMNGMKLLFNLGIPGGPTAGANYYHARKIREEKGCKVATIVPDLIFKYPKIMERLSSR